MEALRGKVISNKNRSGWDFPGGPVVKTLKILHSAYCRKQKTRLESRHQISLNTEPKARH